MALYLKIVLYKDARSNDKLNLRSEKVIPITCVLHSQLTVSLYEFLFISARSFAKNLAPQR